MHRLPQPVEQAPPLEPVEAREGAPQRRARSISATRKLARTCTIARSWGEFFLSSDSVIPTFTRWQSLKHIAQLFPEEENEAFRTIGYTIGGMMIFPGNSIGGKPTLNVARGFNRKIADRMDLTLECIRTALSGSDQSARRYS